MHFSSELLEIEGRGRVEAARVRLGDGRVERIACDGILLSGRFVPESSLVRLSHLELDPASGGPRIDQFGRCSDPAYFAAGNLLRPIETAGWSFREGRRIAGLLAADLRAELPSAAPGIAIDCSGPLKLCVPQRLLADPTPGLAHLQLRVSEPPAAACGSWPMVARCGSVPCPACRSAACWCRWPPCACRRTPGAWKSPSSPPATEPAKRTDHANRRPRPGNHQYPRAGRQPGRQRRYSVGAASPATPSAVRLGRARSAGTAGQPATLPGGQRPGRRHRPRQPGRKLHGLGRPQRRAVVAADRLAGQPHHPAHRASTRQRRRGSGPGTQRPAARRLFRPASWAGSSSTFRPLAGL